MTKTHREFHKGLKQMSFCLEEKNGKRYWMVRYPNHKYSRKNGYVYYHRLVLENKLNRYLDHSKERVWFEDGNTLNTDMANLRLVSVSEHRSLASKSQAVLEPIKCAMCGEQFQPPSSHSLYRSQRCAHWAQERTKWPPPEVLVRMVWRMPTVSVALRLGVSDKAVEKRCKKYDIPKPPRGYWQKHDAGKPIFEPKVKVEYSR